jgi:hypothetical protein
LEDRHYRTQTRNGRPYRDNEDDQQPTQHQDRDGFIETQRWVPLGDRDIKEVARTRGGRRALAVIIQEAGLQEHPGDGEGGRGL